MPFWVADRCGGGGEPHDKLVWRSTQYNDLTYDFGGKTAHRCTGSLPDGKCWPELGVVSESVNYSNVECRLVQLLDDLLDRFA